MSYCEIAPGHPFHGPYHDTVYGYPTDDDAVLFERLALEINQAGLSWLTVLKKWDAFAAAFEGFRPETVASYGAAERDRLLADPGIIRNRLKIDAVIHNAQVICELQRSHGSFAAWLEDRHPLDKAGWVGLFKKTFRFTGGEITGEFLMSTGHMPGAHDAGCPVHAEIVKRSPPWLRHGAA